MSSFRWSNIPIPEGHVIPLIVGLALDVWLPLKIVELLWLRHILGWPLLLLGSLLAAWAVTAFNAMDFSQPTGIIISGPYQFSRNPMYVAWTMIYLGTAVLVNTWWLLMLLPAVIAFTHYIVVHLEEPKLDQKFGEEYREYMARVRRYL
jgi:protein-S-isoprenylcysteine O-methyltransferase Ste14